MIQTCVGKLEDARHFSDEHQCNEDCECIKNEIAIWVRMLVTPPPERFQNEVANCS